MPVSALAEWDWVYTDVDDHRWLHAMNAADEDVAAQMETSSYVENATTSCGIEGWLSIPGFISRLGAPRCGGCCEAVGYPLGDGSPKNDTDLRPLVKRRLRSLDALAARQAEHGGVVVERWEDDDDADDLEQHRE